MKPTNTRRKLKYGNITAINQKRAIWQECVRDFINIKKNSRKSKSMQLKPLGKQICQCFIKTWKNQS